MNYKKIFENLKTVRDFKKHDLKQEVISEIELFANSIETPNGSTFELKFLSGAVYQELNGKVGYFGKLIEAPMYILVNSLEGNNMIDAGYFTEAIRFKINELNLGSCWISLEKESLKDIDEMNENTVSMLAVGEIYNGIFKRDILKESDRNAISDILYYNTWGTECKLEVLNELGLEDAFYYTRLAPSWGNRQPWKFLLNDSKVYIAIEKDDNNKFELETGIISLFFEKACIASGIVINNDNDAKLDEISVQNNYEIRAVYKI